jgi:adenylate cyclase, class 2
MAYINIEIKARTRSARKIRLVLQSENAKQVGVDSQTDTYFIVPTGRLKLREGNIENNLIFYQRTNKAGPKQSDFSLSPVRDPASLKEILKESLGIKVVVAKQREIFYIDNVKFHLDRVEQLGEFVEIEAGNKLADLSVEQLKQQCDYYMKLFEIQKEDLVEESYSDLLMRQNGI